MADNPQQQLICRGEHIPTAELFEIVKNMAAYGLSPLDIQRCIGITAREFEFYYQKSYEVGLPLVITKVGDSVIKAALGGDTRAGLAFLRSRGGWAEKSAVEHSVNPNSLSQDERKRIVDGIMERLKPAPEATSPSKQPKVGIPVSR